MDEKLKSENMQKEQFSGWGWGGVSRTALCWPYNYSAILQNAPFRSQFFKIFFASGGKGALTPPNQNPADALVVVRALGLLVHPAHWGFLTIMRYTNLRIHSLTHVIGHTRQRHEVDWMWGCSACTAVQFSSVRLLWTRLYAVARR